MKHKTAIVVPWFGCDQKGEAELHAWQLATRLAARDISVEVLTTCCRSTAEDWAVNHLPEGLTGEAEREGFAVRRFRVEPRERELFDAANSKLRGVSRESLRPGVSPVGEESEELFCRESIRSPELLKYLALKCATYDSVILLPCIYGLVLEGVHLAGGRSLLQPCLRDEAYAYLPAVARAFYAAKALLFLNEEERQLAIRLYGPGIIPKSILAGAGTEIASWDAVIDRYEYAINDTKDEGTTKGTVPGRASKTSIHQVLPNMTAGDAISNHAIWLRNAFQCLGHPSEIYALGIDSTLSSEVKAFDEGCVRPADAIVYHHSIGSAVTPAVSAHQGPKCLIYHNITPHHFLEPYLPLHTELCKQGREDLPTLAAHFPLSVGDSAYNAAELSELGFSSPGVLPICVNPSKWQIVPDAALMARMQDGRTNVLFVGRYSPNKRQEDLILAFARLRKLDPSARLILVGSPVTANDFYFDCLKQLCFDLGVEDAVEFTGRVRDAQLAAYYRTAHLFWSMSEHEGFCVPLIEAMWFDIPVYAYSSSAVPETMGGAGRLFYSKQDPDAIALGAFQLVNDSSVRRDVIEGQRARREAFQEGPVLQSLKSLITVLLHVESAPTRGPVPEIDPAHVRRIAVVKLDHIGDVLLASPTFESLKRRFPHAAITAVVAPHSLEILRNNPYVDECVSYDAPWFWRSVPSPEIATEILNRNAKTIEQLSAHHFDLVVNLRSDLNNLFVAAALPHTHLVSYTNHTAYPYLITHPLTMTRVTHVCKQHRDLLQVIGADTWSNPALYPSDHDRQVVREIGNASPGTVAIFPGAGIQLKCWSSIKFRELVRRLGLDGIPVVLVGSKADRDFAAEIVHDSGALNLCGKFTLLELGVFLEGCATLVTNDSAPMHIAAAVGTTVVYITRPNTAMEFAPVGSQHLKCCVDSCATPCDGFNAEKRSELADFCRCIQSIGVDEVEAKVRSVLEKARKRTPSQKVVYVRNQLGAIVSSVKGSLKQKVSSFSDSSSGSKRAP